MKTLYETPKMEVINLNQTDIIVTSDGDNDIPFGGGTSAASYE